METCELTISQEVSSNYKIIASIFWDENGIIYVDFLPQGKIIDSLLLSDF